MKNGHACRQAGFTLIETLVALAGVAVVAMAAVGFWVGVLVQRDQAVASQIVTGQPEVVWPVVAKAVREARRIRIEDGGATLKTEGNEECWTIKVDVGAEAIVYGFSSGVGCSAPEVADQQVTGETVQVTGGNFSLVAPNESGRAIEMNMTVGVVRPLWSVTKSYSQIFVNVTDEEVE